MSRTIMFPSCLAVLLIAVNLSGCGDAGASDEEMAAAGQSAGSCCERAGGHGTGAGKDAKKTSACCDDPAGCEMCAAKKAEQMPAGTEVTEALAELPADDRAAAEEQQTCPVTDAALGSMGRPFKITVQGRDVFLCCEMCKDAVTADPEKYLAKLSE